MSPSLHSVGRDRKDVFVLGLSRTRQMIHSSVIIHLHCATLTSIIVALIASIGLFAAIMVTLVSFQCTLWCRAAEIVNMKFNKA